MALAEMGAGVAKRHGIHPNQIYGWKKQVFDNLASLFARGANALGDGEDNAEDFQSQSRGLRFRRLSRLPGRATNMRQAWCNFSFLAHRVISLCCGIWSLSGHSGL
jgi:hypothetical protein